MDSYYTAMREKGFGPDTMRSIRKMKCPNCGFEFSLTYARSFACRGCPSSVGGCPKVRCAKCDYEFYIREMPDVGTKLRERSLQDHINDVMVDYYRENGWKKSR